MTELKELLMTEMAEEEVEKLFELTSEELLIQLNKKAREIGKKQSRYSANSEEYKRLGKFRDNLERAMKILRDKEEKAESGLMAVKEEQDSLKADEKKVQEEQENLVTVTVSQAKAEEIPKRQLEVWYREYESASDNTEVRQKIYADVLKEALDGKTVAWNLLALMENCEKKHKRHVFNLFKEAAKAGDMSAARNVAFLYLDDKYVEEINRELSKKYIDKAAKGKHREAMALRAFCLAGEAHLQEYGYEMNIKEAYLQCKDYVKEFSPLDMNDKVDRTLLYYCYSLGLQCGYDMTKEELSESYRRLLEVENEYSEEAKCFAGDIKKSNGKYEQAVQCYLDEINIFTIEALQRIYFDSYFEKNPLLQRNLEERLVQMRDNESTLPEIRKSLYGWYGWRYENGKKVIQSLENAYIYYQKSCNSRCIERLMKGFSSINERIVFCKKVLEQGCYESALDLADAYKEKYQLEDAIIYYQWGAENAIESSVIEKCSEKYAECRKLLDKKSVQMEEMHSAYELYNTGMLANKNFGFMNLWELAKKGNVYAGLRVAKIAETDSYVQETSINLPSDKVLFDYYRQAALVGEKEAIYRMVDIYEKGQLGIDIDKKKANAWREKL